jgi:hypothetical protein
VATHRLEDADVDRSEGRDVLAGQLDSRRKVSHGGLVDRLLDQQEVAEVIGPSGANDQLEFQAFWDEAPGSVLRVTGSVDGRGWRAFAPITDDFLVAPDGSFIGE